MTFLRVGVVGLGYWGPKLVRNFSEATDSALTWVADLDSGRLQRIRAQYPSVQATTSFDELLSSDVDAVVVATPIRTHYKLAKAALLRDKHVLVEKPLAATVAEARELAELAEQRGLTLMVGHTFQYNAAILTLGEIVRSGELGDIYYVDMARLNLGLFQRDINVLWDLAPHDFSILLHILGADPLSISARGAAHVTPGIHDVAFVELRFPSDIIANVHVSWLDPCKVRRVTVVGSKKMLVCNDIQEVEKIRIYDKGVDRPYETDQFSDFHLSYRYGGVSIPYIPTTEPLRTQVNHFLECIRSSTRPDSDGRMGLRVVRLLELADRSLQQGGTREQVVDDASDN